MLLQENAELAVTLLYLFVQSFQNLAESIGQQYQQDTAGQKNTGEPPIKHNHHNDCTYQLYHHSDQSRQYLDIGIRYHYCIICEPVQPFARMDSVHACKVFSEDIPH